MGFPMSLVAPKTRKHLSADALFGLVRNSLANIPDYRPSETDIALTDALMAAFAMFSLKAPSLLAFDCVCLSPLPASAGQPLPAQAPVPRPVLPESCGAGESRTAGAAGGGKGRCRGGRAVAHPGPSPAPDKEMSTIRLCR